MDAVFRYLLVGAGFGLLLAAAALVVLLLVLALASWDRL